MKVVLFANTDWYLFNFRLSLANALRVDGHDLFLLSPPGPYGERLRSLGFHWTAAPMERKSLNPFREALLLFWLAGWMRQVKPDIVHSFTIKCAVYGSIAARICGARRINAVAGMGFVFTNHSFKARVLRWPVKILLRLALAGRSARLVLQNRDDVSLFSDAAIVPSCLIRMIPGSGVDCEKFQPPSSEQRASDLNPVKVLLAGRLLWDKGIAEFVSAARLLRGGTTSLEFILAGTPDPGNPASVPIEDVTRWQSEGLVVWLGHVDEMASLLMTVDIVVLPSYREGLPKSLIEAAACARALIATDVPGCRDVIDHEVNGLLVNVRDTADLANAILRLAVDADLRSTLGQAAREKAISQFDENIILSETRILYEELRRRPRATLEQPCA